MLVARVEAGSLPVVYSLVLAMRARSEQSKVKQSMPEDKSQQCGRVTLPTALAQRPIFATAGLTAPRPIIDSVNDILGMPSIIQIERGKRQRGLGACRCGSWRAEKGPRTGDVKRQTQTI